MKKNIFFLLTTIFVIFTHGILSFGDDLNKNAVQNNPVETALSPYEEINWDDMRLDPQYINNFDNEYYAKIVEENINNLPQIDLNELDLLVQWYGEPQYSKYEYVNPYYVRSELDKNYAPETVPYKYYFPNYYNMDYDYFNGKDYYDIKKLYQRSRLSSLIDFDSTINPEYIMYLLDIESRLDKADEPDKYIAGINANIEDWENADYSSLINTCSFPYEPLPEYRKEQLIKLYGEPKDINDFVNPEWVRYYLDTDFRNNYGKEQPQQYIIPDVGIIDWEKCDYLVLFLKYSKYLWEQPYGSCIGAVHRYNDTLSVNMMTEGFIKYTLDPVYRLTADDIPNEISVYKKDIIIGDLDMDGTLTASDASLLLSRVLRDDTYIDADTNLMLDVNSDNIVDTVDATKILQKSLDTDYTY